MAQVYPCCVQSETRTLTIFQPESVEALYAVVRGAEKEGWTVDVNVIHEPEHGGPWVRLVGYRDVPVEEDHPHMGVVQ